LKIHLNYFSYTDFIYIAKTLALNYKKNHTLTKEPRSEREKGSKCY